MGSNKNEKRKPKSAVYRSFWASVVYFHLRLISTKSHKGEMTRNQFGSNPTRVRIPPAAPRRRGRHIVRGDFFTKVTSHSFCRGSFPNRTRYRWAPVWVRRCAAVFSGHEKILILTSPSSPPQATYRLRRAFSFHCKAHRALILLLLATKPDPLSLGSGLVCRPAGGSGLRNTHLFGARGLLARSTLRDSNARQK